MRNEQKQAQFFITTILNYAFYILNIQSDNPKLKPCDCFLLIKL